MTVDEGEHHALMQTVLGSCERSSGVTHSGAIRMNSCQLSHTTQQPMEGPCLRSLAQPILEISITEGFWHACQSIIGPTCRTKRLPSHRCMETPQVCARRSRALRMSTRRSTDAVSYTDSTRRGVLHPILAPR